MRETKRGDWKRGSQRDHLKPTRQSLSFRHRHRHRGIDREKRRFCIFPQMLTIVDPQTRALSTPPITQPPAPWWVMTSPAAANGTLRPPPGALCPALTGRAVFWGPAGPGCWVAPSTERGQAVARRFYRRETHIPFDWVWADGRPASELVKGVCRQSGNDDLEGFLRPWGGWRRISVRSRVMGICKRQPKQGQWMGNLPCSWHLLLSSALPTNPI